MISLSLAAFRIRRPQSAANRGGEGGLTNQLPICPVLMCRRWMFTETHESSSQIIRLPLIPQFQSVVSL